MITKPTGRFSSQKETGKRASTEFLENKENGFHRSLF
jgi:hypothetical protein